MEGTALRKNNMHGKTAVLKLFIGGYKRCHTTDAPYLLFLSQGTHYIPEAML